MRKTLLALPLLVAAAAYGATPPQHAAWTRAALSRVPASKLDKTPERAELRGQNLDVFAQEIARVSEHAPLPARQWESLLGALGGIESNFDTDIVAGRCPAWACDHGRAKGAFQNQNVGPVADLWATADGNIVAQVAMADRMLRRSTTRCAPFAPFPAHIFRAYRGGSCSWPVHRETERVGAYLRLMATPAVAK